MKTYCLVLIFLTFCFVISACNECSDTGDAAITPPLRFSIVDSAGKNLVDKTQSHYSADTIRLFDLEEKQWIVLSREYLPLAGGFVFSGDFRKNRRGKSSLLLQLNSVDSDTLDAWYRLINDKCASVYEFTRFEHNGQELVKSPQTPALLLIPKSK